MPVLDGDFEAFVTNLGKYNEGMLVGEWVKLPTTEEEMQKVFERIGIGKQDEFGQPYEEWFITDYECPIYGVQKMLGEYESLDKLNYLAALIDELSLSDQEKLVAIMEAGCDEVSDIDDLINLTFNLDCYDIMPGINDESDLGYYYAHEAGIYSEKDLGPLANYIDYERYGRDIAMDEQGRFTDEGYVRVASERWDRQFNGDLDDIPDEYRITGSGEAAERDSTIAVLVVEPGKEPYVKEIDSGLESLQHALQGRIRNVNKNTAGNRANNLFVCGCCGRKLRKNPAKEPHLVCPKNDSIKGAECAGLFVNQAHIEQAVLQMLREQSRSFLEQHCLMQACIDKKLSSIQTELDANINMTRRLQSRKAELYEQYRAGRISREKFADIQKTDSEKLARLSSRAEEIKRLLVEHYESRGNLAAGKRSADQIILLKDYDPEIIRNFVERVRVYPSGEIEIDMRTSSGFAFVTAS